ncbi:MAG: hypothetical protein ABI068_03425 [Ktedonobacterales bacterium]
MSTTDSFLYEGEGNRVEQVAQATVGITTTTAYYGGGIALAVNGAIFYLAGDGLRTAPASPIVPVHIPVDKVVDNRLILP